MNKQGLLSKIEDLEVTRSLDTNTLRDNFYVLKSEVVTIINQLDEPQKVVIPRFVAEWIEENKKSTKDLKWVFNAIPDDRKVYEWMTENSLLFFKAWLDGYEVEQEKLYTVEIPNPRIIGNEFTVLMRNGFKEIVMLREYGDGWKQQKAHQLTEAEIKQDFEWAWNEGFSEEVKE